MGPLKRRWARWNGTTGMAVLEQTLLGTSGASVASTPASSEA
jgi:hypothetical protein